MRYLLGSLARAATRWPKQTLAALAAVTVAMAALASGLSVQVDLAQLGSEDSEAVQAMDRIRADFADPSAVVQVIVDAGSGGNVLDRSGMEALRSAGQVAVEALGPDVRTDGSGRPLLLSPAVAVESALTQQGRDIATANEEQLRAVVAAVLTANPQVAGLVADDVDPRSGTARAAAVAVPLDQRLTEQERTEAGERVQAAFAGELQGPLSDVRVTVFSSGLFVAGLLDAIRAEVPRLFALALLMVLAVLALMYRSLFDVAVGFAGLLATVVWTLGFAALLGPPYLGWTGPLTQLVVVIPVLLVGLGIDYSVHLVARYREQRAAGQPPAAAASRALHTVGAALVLATVATSVGFGSIAVAPLRMLADFGVVVAAGVVFAFLVMGFGVPAARVWRDRASSGADRAVRELGMARLMRAPAWLATRTPAAGVAVAVLLVGASLLAATGLAVEFDRADFVPEGSDIEATLAHQAELFGGGVTESTFVLVDGDLTDPTVANAVRDAQASLGGLDGVRSVGGTPQVVSVFSLLAAVLGPGARDGPDLAASYERLRAAVGEQLVAQLLAPDAQSAVVQLRTTAGDAGAERLGREVEAAYAPVESAGAEITVTSEPIIVGEMSQELGVFQARAIGLTLAVVLVLLTGYYALARRRWLLGVIAMIPAAVSAALILGTMWLLGISVNVLTATLTAIAIGIGVPYGVHVVNRFGEDLEDAPAADAAARTLRGTGAALTGSALTTLGAFVVLAFSGLPPMRSLGLLGGVGIAFALLAALFVEPGALVLWGRRQARQADEPALAAASPPRSTVS